MVKGDTQDGVEDGMKPVIRRESPANRGHCVHAATRSRDSDAGDHRNGRPLRWDCSDSANRQWKTPRHANLRPQRGHRHRVRKHRLSPRGGRGGVLAPHSFCHPGSLTATVGGGGGPSDPSSTPGPSIPGRDRPAPPPAAWLLGPGSSLRGTDPCHRQRRGRSLSGMTDGECHPLYLSPFTGRGRAQRG